MEKKKKKIESQKYKMEALSREKAERMKQNLINLNAKTNILASQKITITKDCSKTSTIHKLLSQKQVFSIDA